MLLLAKPSRLYMVFIAILMTLCVDAQVRNYSFSASTGVVPSMSQPKVLINPGVDDGSSVVTALPFEFYFGNGIQKQFSVSSNGVIGFGTNAVTSSPNNGGFGFNTIAPFWDDLITNSQSSGSGVQYEVLGAAPNRQLVIRWIAYNNTSAGNVQFYCILEETTSRIRFIYESGTGGSASIGLSSNDYLTVNSLLNTASATIPHTGSSFPTATTEYIFTPPAECSGIPNVGNTVADQSSTCGAVSLSLSVPTIERNLSYEWQTSTDNINYTLFNTGAATVNYNQNTARYYRCKVTCLSSGLSNTSTPVLVTMKPSSQCVTTVNYCTPVANNCSYNRYINRVVISGGPQTVNNATLCETPNGYGNYTSRIASQVQGGEVSLALSTNYPQMRFIVWVDYNKNGYFDGNERVFFTSADALTHNGTFVIPANIAVGSYRIRVKADDSYSYNDPCYYYTYYSPAGGETEDYTLNVLAAQPCSNGFVVGAAASTLAEVCPTTSFTVSVAVESLLNLSYQWQSSADGVNYTNINGATSRSHTTTQSEKRYYRCAISCNNGVPQYSTATVVAMSILNDCYCIPDGSVTSSNYISRVITIGGNTNFNKSSNYTTRGFADYTGLSASGLAGQQLSLSVTLSGPYTNTYNAWVDWNRNGIFENTERIISFINNTGSNSNLSSSFVIPDTASTGTYRLRVRSYPNSSGNIDACANYGNGETEDYSLEVVGQPACNGSLSSAATSFSGVTATACLQVPFTLTADYSLSGLSYQWQSSTDGISYTNIGGATGKSYTTTQVVATYYRCLVTCISSTSTAYTTALQVTMSALGNCYCIPLPSIQTNSTYYISNVSTTGGATNFSHSSAGSTSFYSDFSATGCSQYPGMPISLSFAQFGSSNFVYSVWVDFNSNGVFDASERMLTDVSTSPATFIIPANITAGTYRLRVKGDMNSGMTDACARLQYGETEDYSLTVVIPPPPCTGTPAPGNTLADASSGVCASESFRLSLQNIPPGVTGFTFQWQSSNNGITYTNINQATDSFLLTSQTSATYYKCIVTCGSTGLSAASNPLQIGMKAAGICYCIPAASSSPTSGYISSVKTFGGILNIDNSSAASPTDYIYYSGVTASQYAGQNLTFNFTSDYLYLYSVWVDWNDDGVFDASELMIANGGATTSFTVPQNALAGTHRMRIRGFSSNASTTNDACISASASETEDYDLVVLTAVACNGVPAPGNTFSSANAVCPTTAFTLSLQNSFFTSGITYQWQVSANNVSFTSIPGATSATYTTTQNTNNYYRCVVTCTNSGSSTNSTSVNVTMATLTSCYCVPVTSTQVCTGGFIQNVTSTGGVVNFNNTSACGSTSYTDFSASKIVSQNRSEVVTLTFTSAVNYLSYAAWVDWNDDGIFAAGERVISIQNSQGAYTISASFTVPGNANAGTHRIRVRADQGLPNDGCSNLYIGETEDYAITVLNNANCSGTPDPGYTYITGLTGSQPNYTACVNTDFTLRFQNAITGAGLIYQWQVSTDGVNYTNIFKANGAIHTLNINSINNLAYYRCYITCTGSNQSVSSTPVIVTRATNSNCYCIPQPSVFSCADGYISNVTATNNLSDFNKSSTCSINSYTENTESLSQYRNSTVTLNVSSAIAAFRYRVWVDWNNDGSFSNTELVATASNNSNDLANVAISFVVPFDAPLGSHRIRIRGEHNNVGVPADACNRLQYGETEDYSINVIDVPVNICTGVLSPGKTLSNNANPVCPGVFFTLSTENQSLVNGLTYQWQISTDGVNFNDIFGATDTTFSTSQNSANYYRCKITCSNGNSVSYSVPLHVTMNALANCFCIPPPTVSSCSMAITNVASYGGVTNFNNSSSCNIKTFADYSSTISTSQYQGRYVTLQFTLSYNNNNNYRAAAWVDWNKDGEFSDSERVMNISSSVSGSFKIPENVVAGNYRLRLRCDVDPIVGGCSQTRFGETEDYTITVITAPDCNATPSPGNTLINGANPICAETYFTLRVQNVTAERSIAYQWQSSVDGVVYKNIDGATADTMRLYQLQSTYYRCVVTCLNSNASVNTTPLQVVQSPSKNCYCIPPVSSNACYNNTYYISSVAVTGGLTSFTNTSACSATSYTDYSATRIASQYRGSYANITFLEPTSNYSLRFNAWIDFDDDGVFSPSELVVNNSYHGSVNSFQVPVDAPAGTHRMRVRAENYNASNLYDGCSQLSMGETEDYSFTVVAYPNCSGTFAPGNTILSGATNPVCSGKTFILSLQNNANITGLTYQWQSSTNGTTYINIPGATDKVYTTSQTTATYYRCVVTCTPSGLSANSSALNVTMNSPGNCYCTPGQNYGTNCLIWITGVTTTGGVANFTNTSTCATSSYTNYSATRIVSQYRGVAVNLNFSSGTTKSGSLGYAVWVDWNDDAEFSYGELMGTTATNSLSFFVPANATLGTHRLRVRGTSYVATSDVNGNPTSFGPNIPYDPCNTFSYGETEDYGITVLAVPACSGTPVPGNTVSSGTNPICANTSFTLSMSNNITTAGITYQWQYSINGGVTYYNINGATGKTIALSQTTATYYRCAVTCNNSNITAYSTPLNITMAAVTNCYCTPVSSCASYYISGVSSLGGVSNFVNTGTTCGQYTNYSASKVVTQVRGSSVSLRLVSTRGMSYGVWVDFNDDGIFDASEKVIHSANNDVTITTITESFIVPLSAPVGTHRMRIRGAYNYWGGSAQVPNDPCAAIGDSETEDYALTVQAVAACNGTPVAGTTVSSAASICQGIDFTLSINQINQSGITYQWQQSANGTNFSDIPGANSFIYVTNQTAATYYRCVVKCANSNAVSNSTSLLVSMAAISSCYCTPPTSAYACNASYGYVNNVSTTGGVTNFTNATTCTASSYANYSGSRIASQYAGKQVTMNLSGSVAGYEFTVWVDYDDDGVFESTEVMGSAYASSTAAVQATFTIPVNTKPGTHRMRVRGDYWWGGSGDPCGQLSYGETEDYALTVLAPVACSGTPPSTINITANNNIAICLPGAAGANLTLNNIPAGVSGFIYQWQTSKNGAAYTNISNANATTYVSGSLAGPATYGFRCVITCTNSNLSYTTNIITYTVYEVPSISASATSVCPVTGSVTLTAKPSGKIYSWSVPGSPTTQSITVNNSGTYNVSVNQGGCTSSGSVTITALPVPTINSLTVTPAAICSGDSAILNVSARLNNVSNYCSVNSNCGSDYINNVTFSTINRNSACEGYVLISATNPVIVAGTSVPLSVTTSGDREGVAVWIDMNQNGVFESSEIVLHNYLATNPASYTANVTIPVTAVNGVTRMRVRCAFNDDPAGVGACGNIAAGETEDYLITITGAQDPISYTWSPASNLNTTSGSRVKAYPLTAATTYTVTATSANGCVSTQSILAPVNPLPQGTLSGNTICNGGNGMLTFTASAGTGPFTVVYNDGVADRTQNNVSSGIAFAVFSDPSTTTNYSLVSITANGTGCSRTSGFTGGVATITLVNAPPITQQPTDINVCVAANASFNVIATGAGLLYQWQLSTNGGTTWSNISNGAPYSGATSPTLTITNAIVGYNGYKYRVVVTGSCSSISNEAILSVNTQTTVTSHPVNRVICAGVNTSFSVTSSVVNVAYQWQSSTDGVTWVDISGETSATYSIPSATSAMNGLRFRAKIVSGGCTPVFSNAASLTVNTSPIINTQPVNVSVCTGSAGVFSVSASGTGISYQWQVSTNGGSNWSNIATATSASYNTGVTTVAQNNNQYRVVINGACAPAVSSAAAILTVSSASSIITQPQSTSICESGNALFTVAAVGAGLSYQWQSSVNGVTWSNMPGETMASLQLSNVAASVSGMRYRVLINGSCGPQIISNSATITVTPQVTPSVSVSASATSICAGTSVTFTATPTNGGSGPIYQWKLNGVNVGTNTDSYTNNSLVNGDVITCELTSNANCTSTATAVSNNVTIAVTSQVTPSVSIAASATSICAGTSVTFTATPINGGSSPSYQWKLNGANVGTGSNTYTNNSLVNGDVITCELTSNANCTSTATAVSNNITIAVTSQVTPSVSVVASATSICAGTGVTFTATPINGGTSPSHQWKLNGSNVGTNSNTYTNNTLANGDVITCELTSNAGCTSTATAVSNNITIAVTSQVTPSVSIAASATSICAGTSVTLTATPTNGGASQTYQWKLNGVNVGTNSNTYTNSSLVNSDIITCELTSNAGCTSTNTAISNNVTISVTPQVTPSVSIAASATSICAGTGVTFTASPINGGTSPSYQWKLNGSNVGTNNNNTYTNNSLANGDVIICEMTSNASCTSTATATSNGITISVIPQVTPSVSIVASATSVCAGTGVTFAATPTNGGTSPIYQWKLNGANVGTNSNTYTNNTLANGDVITCELTSNANCTSISTAISNNISIAVTSQVTPSVSIAASATSICAGTSVTFTASSINGGSSPIYQWKLNGANVGTNNNTYTNNSLTNGDVITCELTSNAGCASANTATSNSVTVAVTPQVTPSVSVAASATSICAGSGVTFTATPTNGGTASMYQWKLNGANVGTNSNTYTNNSLANGDVISCELTSNAGCTSANTATSNSVAVAVTPQVTPSVSIAASATSICAGTGVTFTGTPTNGGTSPIYQWKLNGANVGTNSNTYTNNTLANGDVISCELISNATCTSTSTATSNTVAISVTPQVTPSVSVTASATSICAGTGVTFTATSTNGGSSPTYQWKLNGANVGIGSNTYTNTSLVNGDVIICELTSNASCTSIATAISNNITITVTPQVTPSVSIAANATSICAGTSVTFTATPTNGGTSPTYQWKLNGANVGTGSNTYTNNSLVNGDVITCELTSNANCTSTATAVSNNITIAVTSQVTPSVSIAASATSICAGTGVTFTATPINGGTTPSYQWKLNGVNVGTNSDTYNNNSLVNGDIITCELTSNAGCTSVNAATSNSVTISVTPQVTPSVSIAASATSICAGTSVTFTTSSINGGTAPTYQWKLNGANVGTNSNTYTNNSLVNSDIITCELTSNASCTSTSTAVSNNITIAVTPQVTPSLSIAASATSICAGTSVTLTATPTNGGASPTYQWKLNGVNVGTNSNAYTNSSLVNSDIITCELTSNAGCTSTNTAISNNVTISVTPQVTPFVSIAASATSICAGTGVTFAATPTNGGTSPTYQWKLNGANVGTNTNSYTNNSLANGDIITCELTSNANCTSISTAISNNVTITVTPQVTPSVSIAASATSICAGTSVTFTATPTNSGSGPIYQWKLNGVNVGTNTDSYTNNSLVNGDVITCELTSNANCTSTATAISNNVTIAVTPQVTPSVSIAASATSICAGSSVAFTATPTNGGTTPSYQWKLNGANVGTGSNTYTNNSLVNGDVITCELTSNANCTSTATAVSNNITIAVTSQVTPSLSIAASATSICAGTGITFTATSTNGGTSPTYQWKLNGANVGTNSNTYTNNTLANGDVITCELTSNASCTSTATAVSNNITIAVTPQVIPSVSIAASATSICAGTGVTFTATPTNGGSSPIYQWKLNGGNVGTGTNAYTNSSLKNGDVITFELISNANCASTATTVSQPLAIKVFPVPVIIPQPDITVLQNGQSNLQVNVSGGASFTYQWSPANYLNNDKIPNPVCKPLTNVTYSVVVKNEGGCSATGLIKVNVTPFIAISAFSPNGDGINDTWQVADLSSYPGAVVEVFDRRGASVFKTSVNKPWDGTIHGRAAAVGTYYYVVKTNIPGMQPLTGWVQLIR